MATPLAAGFPKTMAKTYFSFHQRLSIYNGLAQKLGPPRTRAFSIPQICPPQQLLVGRAAAALARATDGHVHDSEA
eukprot:6733831-Lingulodinium_polyedra.AAC.1